MLPLRGPAVRRRAAAVRPRLSGDRKSTRLNSSHSQISYAVFCLKKKKNAKDASFESMNKSLDLTRPTPVTHCIHRIIDNDFVAVPQISDTYSTKQLMLRTVSRCC